ncbi:MAG TPA: hypothetical protein VNM24_07930 [Burkholderiales bacterium]|jgi:hypothetical protein|nr:hypothetical protein [Burkholderiales bacterium]
MDSGAIESPGSSEPRRLREVHFLDVRDLEPETDDWTPVYLVYAGSDRAGVIEFEPATAYYKFTALEDSPGMPLLGDFSLDALKRRVIEWLSGRG